MTSHVVDLSDTFLANDYIHDSCFTDDHTSDVSFQCPVPTYQLVELQKSDPELSPLLQEYPFHSPNTINQHSAKWLLYHWISKVGGALPPFPPPMAFT